MAQAIIERPVILSPAAEPPRSVFAPSSDLFARYRCEIAFLDKVLGGTPKDPHVMDVWLRTKASATTDQEEIRQRLLDTLIDMGYEASADASYADLVAASKELAGEQGTSGFKFDNRGLFLESRQIKALLRETVNIVYGDRPVELRKNKTTGKAVTKGAKAAFVERVFCDTPRIYLGRQEADGLEFRVGHIVDRQGPRATLGYYEYVERAEITFEISVLRDYLTPDDWADIWRHAEKNGLGAVRSQDFGRFVVTGWERI